jgi:hypothetical protein
MGGTCIDDKSLALLLKSIPLEELTLGDNITDRSDFLLANSRTLRYLDLGSSQITDAGLLRIGKSKSLKTLRIGNLITSVNVARMRAQHPHITVLGNCGKMME